LYLRLYQELEKIYYPLPEKVKEPKTICIGKLFISTPIFFLIFDPPSALFSYTYRPTKLSIKAILLDEFAANI